MSAEIAVDDELATLTFSTYDLDAYRLFVAAKALPESRTAYDWRTDTYTMTTPARFAPLLGLERPVGARDRLPLAAHLDDYQAWAVGMALDARRFALWLDTGLGKTPCYLEWARQVRHLTGGRVLIVAPLGIHDQVLEMAAGWYGDGLPIERLATRADLIAWCERPGAGIAIVNQQKLIEGKIPELRRCAGIVIDEASWLKTGGGVTKWNAIHSCTGVPYKLSCTATPAPNEAMEYASHAAWLETIRTEGEVLWTFFQSDRKTGEWFIKPHAKAAFYRFLASWSLYMRDPKAFGFRDVLADLPPLAPPVEEAIPMTDEQRALLGEVLTRAGKGMFGDKMGVQERSKLAQIARGFRYVGTGKGRTVERVPSRKVERVVEIAEREIRDGRQVLVWTTFDEEAEILAPLIRDRLPTPTAPGQAIRNPVRTERQVSVLHGSDTDAARADVLARFAAGEVRCLISKPQLIGYGLNLQHVRSMVFAGFDDSFERMYQAVRRAHRRGQTQPVRVFVPYVPELEGMVFGNVKDKEARFLAEVATQEAHYRAALAELAPITGRAA